MFRKKDEHYRDGAHPGSENVRAQKLFQNGSRPKQRQKVNDCAQPVTEQVPENSGQHVGRGVEGRGGRKKFARVINEATQAALAVKQA